MRFVKNTLVHKAFIPGVGWIQSGHILEGEEYAKFAPNLLVEIPDTKPRKPLESTEPAGESLVEPAPSPIPEVSPPPTQENILEEELELAVPVRRPRGPKNALKKLEIKSEPEPDTFDPFER